MDFQILAELGGFKDVGSASAASIALEKKLMSSTENDDASTDETHLGANMEATTAAEATKATKAETKRPATKSEGPGIKEDRDYENIDHTTKKRIVALDVSEVLSYFSQWLK